ncbi:hypothetical protein [Kordiimonas sp.]|uniref:hypothetical protein n=1 Tax=Kordiimonas sp. TaxID=1970157 RepID=UPI003B52468C
MKKLSKVQGGPPERSGQGSLHDICCPEEVAEALKIAEPDTPLADIGRRRDVAARNGNLANVRFWDEVIRILTGEKTISEQRSDRKTLH